MSEELAKEASSQAETNRGIKLAGRPPAGMQQGLARYSMHS